VTLNFSPVKKIGQFMSWCKDHFVVWNVSTGCTWVFGAFPLSLAMPNWARDYVQPVVSPVKEIAVQAFELAVHLWTTYIH